MNTLIKTLSTGIAATVLLGSTAFARFASFAEDGSKGHHGAIGAPEINPGLAAAGIVLLVGGTLVLTGRRRPASS
jgi:LPXTG-motif cell wall-anchored protein